MTRAVGASERVFEIIDRQPLMNISGGLSPFFPPPLLSPLIRILGMTPISLVGRVQFTNVSFCYPARKDKLILNNFSLSLAPGQVMGIKEKKEGIADEKG